MRTITIVKFCGIPIFTIITFEKGDEQEQSKGFIVFGTPLPEDSTLEGGVTFMSTIINTNQKVQATAKFTDDEGNPKDVTGVQWASDNAAVADVTDNGDGTATIRTALEGSSELGAATITATDPASGTVLSGVVEVTAGDAVTGEIAFGTPEPE